MIRTILVPLDRSAFGERAVPFAAGLAGALGSKLVLVEAVNVHVFPGADGSAAQMRAAAEATGYLNDQADRVRAGGLEVETGVAFGDPAAGILAEVAVRQADLVVMATHGRSGLGRLLHGSVAEGVLHTSPVPVILLQAQQGEQTWRGGERPRLIVPLDGSEFGEAALPLAVSLTKQLGGELTLLHALDLPNPALMGDPAVMAELPDVELVAEDTRDYLGAVRERLARESGITAELEVREGGAAQVIGEVSREQQAALVVMSTHGRSGASRTLFGSVAGGALRLSAAPLLLVRPDPTAATAGESQADGAAAGTV